MPTNYLYVRTSTKDQKYGLDTQKQFMLDNINKLHINNNIEIIQEQKSARKVEDRELLIILSILEPKDVLYVYDIGRLTRADESKSSYQAVYEQIRAKGADLVIGLQLIDPENYEQELQMLIGGAIANYQRKVQNAKSRAAIKVKKNKGEWIYKGNLYGYIVKSKDVVEIVPEEADIIKYIFTEYIKGESLNKIATNLNDKKLYRKEREWRSVYIKRIITNPIYAGFYQYDRNRQKIRQHEQELIQSIYYKPIIDLDTWKSAQVSYKTIIRKHQVQHQYRYSHYDLAGIVKCGHCLDLGVKTTYVHSYLKRFRKNGIKVDYSVYTDRVHAKGCSQSIYTIQADVLEQVFRIAFCAFVSAPAEIMNFFLAQHEEMIKIAQKIEFMINNKNKQINDLQIQIDNAAQVLIQSNSPALAVAIGKQVDDLQQQIDFLKTEIVKLKSELNENTPDMDNWDRIDAGIDLLLYNYINKSKREIYIKYIDSAVIKSNELTISYINGKSVKVNLERNKGPKRQNLFNFTVLYNNEEQYKLTWRREGDVIIRLDSDTQDKWQQTLLARRWSEFDHIYYLVGKKD